LRVTIVALMPDYLPAINLICKFQGYNEKAYPDVETGGSPYSIGYGTQTVLQCVRGNYALKRKQWNI
jgi:hypothetical protein